MIAYTDFEKVANRRGQQPWRFADRVGVSLVSGALGVASTLFIMTSISRRYYSIAPWKCQPLNRYLNTFLINLNTALTAKMGVFSTRIGKYFRAKKRKYHAVTRLCASGREK